jgi:exodeoxyribonuclease-5
MKLTEEQSKAFDDILDWFNDSNKKLYYVLAGYAGVGKGYLIKYLIEYLKSTRLSNVIVGTFTWKASLVLINRGIESRSLHSIFYNVKDPLEESKEEKESKVDSVSFKPRTTREIINKFGKLDLIVIDEASMVDKTMIDLILSHKIPVLLVGDSEQLPSIGVQSNIMLKPDFLLTTIQRQALDSPIIRLSMDIRNGRNIPYGKYGDRVTKIKKQFDFKSIPTDYIIKADMILCGKNDTRKSLNKYIRHLKGIDPELAPIAGERLVCLKNLHNSYIFNGMILTVLENDNYNQFLADSDLFPTVYKKDISFKFAKQDVFMSRLVFDGNNNLVNKKLGTVLDEKQRNLFLNNIYSEFMKKNI